MYSSVSFSFLTISSLQSLQPSNHSIVSHLLRNQHTSTMGSGQSKQSGGGHKRSSFSCMPCGKRKTKQPTPPPSPTPSQIWEGAKNQSWFGPKRNRWAPPSYTPPSSTRGDRGSSGNHSWSASSIQTNNSGPCRRPIFHGTRLANTSSASSSDSWMMWPHPTPKLDKMRGGYRSVGEKMHAQRAALPPGFMSRHAKQQAMPGMFPF
jgi:hypothetical protein